LAAFNLAKKLKLGFGFVNSILREKGHISWKLIYQEKIVLDNISKKC
jgi:hypothetical protein